MDIYDLKYQENLNYAFHIWGGQCAAIWGWDNFDAPDATQEYNKFICDKIRYAWVGNRNWLEAKLAKDYP